MTPTEIRQHREALGLTCDELAKKLGYTHAQRRSTISRWETGERTPPPSAIILLKKLHPAKSKKQ
jgi:DNA-binding transcriptional regulator YiaG